MNSDRRLPLFMLPLSLLTMKSRADYDFTNGVQNYRLVTTAKAWDAAETDAVSKGGHLVRINDVAENTAIFNAVSTRATTTASDGGGSKYVWIGGKETTEGTYVWAEALTTAYWTGGTSGSASGGAYQNWGRLASPYGGPEPDNYQGTQNRAAMALEKWPAFATTGQIGNGSQWNDINGTNSLAYVIEWTPFQWWQKTYWTGTDLTTAAKVGSAADPDNDGLNNLLEFAFGGNPTTLTPLVSESGGTIVSTGKPIARPGSTPVAVFARRKNFTAEGLTYLVQFSTNLAGWTDSATIPTVLADNGTMQIVSLPFPALAGGQARFFRIRVTL